MRRFVIFRPAIIVSFRRFFSIRAASPPIPGSKSSACASTGYRQLAEGFAQIAEYIEAAGRPLTSFCACELALAGGIYRGRLSPFQRALRQDAGGMEDLRWHHQSGGAQQCLPGNRSADRAVVLCLLLYAPEPAARRKVSSSPAAPRRVVGCGSYPERIVRYRDAQPGRIEGESPASPSEPWKAGSARSDFGWKDTTAAQAYTVHDFHPVIADELVRRGATRSGLTWHFARPPVIDLEYEMDCRRVTREVLI